MKWMLKAGYGILRCGVCQWVDAPDVIFGLGSHAIFRIMQKFLRIQDVSHLG